MTQLTREFGAYVIGTGGAADRHKALGFGAKEFVGLVKIRAGGTLVTIAGPPEARAAHGQAIDFVALPDRAQLGEIVKRARDGRLRTNIGNVATLDDAVTAFKPSGSAGRRSSAFVRERHVTIPATTKETHEQGDNSHEGDRGDGPGSRNGRNDADGAARAGASDQRCRRSGSCVGIRPD
ncbi:hypothetical protein [Streptomyces sp. N2A]|uniref:hypothetical protein n=1 Tax=Streptomyces sp. N2A TaxID=3073936 RepID=UPI0028700739|nr:hypothetical protein [Streptomyces sp. N2A]